MRIVSGFTYKWGSEADEDSIQQIDTSAVANLAQDGY